MSGRPPDGTPDLARRDFLKACAALALTGPVLGGCGSLVSNSRFTRLLISDPAPEEYRPILAALIEAVLPFEHPRFPRIPPESVLGRLEEMFPLEEEARLKPLQRSLLLLNDAALFPHAFGPLLSEERKSLRAEGGLDGKAVERLLEEAQARDRSLHAAFAARPGARSTLVAMEPPARREYLWMWSQSAFTLKRQLYRTTKALVMISAYSSPGFWGAIGYAGPLPERT